MVKSLVITIIIVLDLIKSYFESGREYKLILKRLEEVHGVKRRYHL